MDVHAGAFLVIIDVEIATLMMPRRRRHWIPSQLFLHYAALVIENIFLPSSYAAGIAITVALRFLTPRFSTDRMLFSSSFPFGIHCSFFTPPSSFVIMVFGLLLISRQKKKKKQEILLLAEAGDIGSSWSWLSLAAAAAAAQFSPGLPRQRFSQEALPLFSFSRLSSLAFPPPLSAARRRQPPLFITAGGMAPNGRQVASVGFRFPAASCRHCLPPYAAAGRVAGGGGFRRRLYCFSPVCALRHSRQRPLLSPSCFGACRFVGAFAPPYFSPPRFAANSMAAVRFFFSRLLHWDYWCHGDMLILWNSWCFYFLFAAIIFWYYAERRHSAIVIFFTDAVAVLFIIRYYLFFFSKPQIIFHFQNCCCCCHLLINIEMPIRLRRILFSLITEDTAPRATHWYRWGFYADTTTILSAAELPRIFIWQRWIFAFFSLSRLSVRYVTPHYLPDTPVTPI